MRLTNQALGSRALSEIRGDIALRHSIHLPGSDPTLVLDLQFARDQAYVSRRGPLPTFTRASTATLVNSAGLVVSAAINEARIDYNPTTLACLGLLIEEQRTNLASRSQDVTTWQKGGTVATNNSTTSPDGSATAALYYESATNTQHYGYNSPIASVTSGTTYTASMFFKKGSGATAPDWINCGWLGAGFGSRSVAFNVSTGAFGVSQGAGWSYTSKQYPNGWWRVTMTATATATGSHGTFYFAFTSNTNTSGTPTYTGQTTSNVFVWGAQFEAGAFATSYIPTTSASVIRSADVCSITGVSFSSFYNQTEGTLVFRGIKQALQPTATPSYLGVDDATAGNRIILYGGSAEACNVNAGGVAQAAIGGVTQVAALTSFAIAMRYKANDFAFCLNGGTVSTDTSGTVPTVTQMLIGTRLGTNYMGGWIQSVQYYNRIKTNTQLQALSTP